MAVEIETGSASNQSLDHCQISVSTEVFLLNNLPQVNHGLVPISVPWMGAEYDGNSGDFMNYPQRWGFSIDLLLQGRFFQYGARESLAFIQAWLFFGLLKEALGNQNELLSDDWIANYRAPPTTQKSMISPHLTTYLTRISNRLRDPCQHRQTWLYWEEIFATTIAVAEAFDKSFARTCSAEDVDQHGPLCITWSILMLGQILTNTIMECYRVETSEMKHWPDGSILHLRMRRHLQCPHQCNRVMALFAMDAIYYLTLLPFYNRFSDNSSLAEANAHMSISAPALFDEDIAVGTGRHRNCTIQTCLGQKIDEASYRTEHVNSQCECAFDGPEVRKVIQILDHSEVPVFVVRGDSSSTALGRLSVDVLSSKHVAGYVAISHVWADGLGNKADNLLPRCQIARLARLVSSLTGREDQPFWIDTFGIPRELQHRRKALAVMNPTYRLAEKVLVLDGGLQQHTSYRSLSMQIPTADARSHEEVQAAIVLELLLRIICCSWTSRLWTLPEGMLGPELHFQFADGTAEVGDLLAQLRSWRLIGASVVRDIISTLVRLRPKLRTQTRRGLAPLDPFFEKWPHGDLYGQFITMFQALEFRDTTWKEDEATCLAIHLGLDVEAILSRDYAERLQALFAQLDQIPSDLMFTHGDRLAHYPYRWAPRHLLESKDNYVLIPAATPDRRMGVRTDHGLLVQLNAYKLHTSKEHVPVTNMIFFSIWATSDDGVQYPTTYGMMLAALNPLTAPGWRQSQTHLLLEADGAAAKTLYVLLGPGGVAGPPANMEPGHVGLMVCQSKEEDGCVYVDPLDAVAVFKMPGSKTVKPGHVNHEGFVHWHAEEMLEEIFCVG